VAIFIHLGTCSTDHRIQIYHRYRRHVHILCVCIIGSIFLCPTQYMLSKVESSSSKVRVRTEEELEQSNKDPERLEWSPIGCKWPLQRLWLCFWIGAFPSNSGGNLCPGGDEIFTFMSDTLCLIKAWVMTGYDRPIFVSRWANGYQL
jgi:hypothetical protein